MAPRQEDRALVGGGVAHGSLVAFTTLSWPGGGLSCPTPPLPMPAPGAGKEIISGGFWERWRVYFFLQAPKQPHRHIYVDAKKLPEGRRKNNVPDLELRPLHVDSECVYQAPVICQTQS